ncbi:MAG: AgmX/PglI C-terminal domain-containing protein [Myxococcota bacterium]|nr:AgmX/PglI C-terminal domain-containing protein [Myxococcota bacterium]
MSTQVKARRSRPLRGAKTPSRILRVGIVQAGQVVAESTFDDARRVRIGTHPSCEIVVPPGRVPERRQLFVRRRGGWSLCLQGSDTGRLAQDGIQDIAELVGASEVPLGERTRGKVHLGEVTVLFQLVPAPAAVTSPVSFRPRLFDEDDPRFLATLVLTSAAAAVAMVWVVQQPPIERVNVELPQAVREIAFVVPPAPVEPPELVAEVDPEIPGEALPERPEPASATSPAPGGSQDAVAQGPASERPVVAEQAVQQAMLQIFEIGHTGANDRDRVRSQVFGQEDSVGQSLEDALASVGPGAGVSSEGPIIKSGGPSGPGVEGPELTHGPVHSAQVTGPPAPVVVSKRPQLDELTRGNQARIQQALRAVGGQVQNCYVQSLNRNPGFEGRLELQLEVFDGQVMDARLLKNPADAELSACVTRRALTWSLPPDAEGTLVVPYVLTPAQ